MKLSILRLVVLALLAGSIATIYFFRKTSGPESTDQFVEKKKNPGQRMTDAVLAAEFENQQLIDPRTGRIPEGIFEAERAQARQIYEQQMAAGRTLVNTYTYQGPDNLGGRTRALIYDLDWNGGLNQILYAGGVSGALYKSIDDGATWVRKSNLSDHFSVTSIAQDPTDHNILYYTSGEPLGNSASQSGGSYYGHGVFKSTDRGETWTRLTTSNPSALETFTDRRDFLTRVIVAPNGDVFLAAVAGIYRSTDDGATWTLVLSGTFSNSGQTTDIIAAPNGRLYAGFGGTNSVGADGVWTSTDNGATSTWTRIAGGGSPVGWDAQNSYGRVVLSVHALASDTLLFALYYNNDDNDCVPETIEADLFRYNEATDTWTDLSANLPDVPAVCLDGNDPFACQGGYDLLVTTKPDDENVVFIGGTNLYRSTDGFTSNTNTTRIGGYNSPSNYAIYPNSHPDMHTVAFEPGSPSSMLCANDGGIQRTTNNLAGSVSWTQINEDYTTFQFYHVTVHPASGNNKVMGGTQDNGTVRNVGGTGSTHELIYGGDGVSVGLSNPISGNSYEYAGSQLGNIVRRNAASLPQTGISVITPSGASGGQFVTVFRLDYDNTEILYYANDNQLWRTISASTVNSGIWTELTGVATAVGAANDITFITMTRGTYSASTASLFFGTSNGQVFRLDDPTSVAAETAAPENITGAFPAGSISSLSVNPRNDDTLLVTFSNYSIVGLWWTGNANAASPTWVDVEDNLILPSFRSSAIAVTSLGVEYFVGTSVGLYTALVDGGTPTNTNWAQDGVSEIGNAVVRSIALRPSDNRLLIGTHGFGMWVTNLTMAALPVSLTEFKGKLQKENVMLEWSTAFEQNNRGFEIERSYDGIAFRQIGFVQSAGTSNSIRRYSFLDPDRAMEHNYYRLKMVDLDNTHELSKTILVKYANSQQEVFVMNNPFNSQVGLRFARVPKDKVGIQLFDMKGRKVFAAEYHHSTPSVLMVDLGKRFLARGTYAMLVRTEEKTFRIKLLKNQ